MAMPDLLEKARRRGAEVTVKVRGRQLAAAAPADDDQGADKLPRPIIMVSHDEHRVNDDATRALARDPAIYQRSGCLVRVLIDESPAGAGIRRPLSPRIDAIPQAILRERMACVASWMSRRKGDDGAVAEHPVHPPVWSVAALHARGTWQGIPHLESVVEYPVIRADGSLLMTPGYDPDTGLLLTGAVRVSPGPGVYDRKAARKAAERLLQIVRDFPFKLPCHRSAWLAALLTPLARFAFRGPAPLFLVDANVRGAGKGLLLHTISLILTGERLTVCTYSADDDEMRKRITSIALTGDRLVLWDNIAGRLGSPSLDAALTATHWRDRALGSNRMLESPLHATWYATGNNVSVVADTARRTCHVRLESPLERPETRADFKSADLLAEVAASRADYLRDALTILRSYVKAGYPVSKDFATWGSYEAWSRVIRGAIVWIDLPDPAETREQLQEQCDIMGSTMSSFLLSLSQLDPLSGGLTAAEIIDRAKIAGEDDLRESVEQLTGGKLDSRSLGNRLRSNRRRIFGGRYLDTTGSLHRAVRWASFDAQLFTEGKTHDASTQREKSS